MTQRAPKHRRSVKEYREEMESSCTFPAYFNGLLYDLFLKLHWNGSAPDDRVRIISESFGDILENIAQVLFVSSRFLI